MNFSTQIKDSTLRETSCTNHVHYLEVGNYMPILHPTANTSLPGTDARMNKIFIAAYDYAEGDVYSIFGQELSLVNRDLKIYTGDYVKATIDFSDNSIKLVNISRVTYTPNTELGDIDYTYDVVIGSSRVTIHEQKIYLTENTDISINTTAYANMPAGTLYLELYNGSTLLNTSAYSANIAKRYVLQNAFSMPDMPIDTHLDIKVKLYFVKEDPDDPDCVLENRAAAVSVTGKNIEWDYDVWTPVADDEIGYYYQVEANDSVTLMYPYSKNNRHKIGVLPATVDNKPVKTINQLLLFNMENFESQDNVDILVDIVDNNGILIDGGSFYNTKIGMVIPNDKPVDVREFAFANSEVRNSTFTQETILARGASDILNEYPAWFILNPPYVLEINNTNWLNTKVPSYCFDNCKHLGMVVFVTNNCVSIEEGAFANDKIHYLYFDEDSVVRVEPNSFKNSTIRHLTIAGDYPNISLQKLCLDNSTIYENFRLPRIDDCVLYNVYGLIDYTQDNFYHYEEDAFGHKAHNYYEDAAYWATNFKNLKIEGTWYDIDFNKVTDLPPTEVIRNYISGYVNGMNPARKAEEFAELYVGKTMDSLSLNLAYCGKFEIERRNQSVEIDYNVYDENDNIIVGPDDSYNKGFFKMVDDCYYDQLSKQPLQIDKLYLYGYDATPRITLHIIRDTITSGSSTSYSWRKTWVEVLKKPQPIDLRHVVFSENTDLQALCRTEWYSTGDYTDTASGSKSMYNSIYSTIRLLLPKYCQYIPIHTGVQKKSMISDRNLADFSTYQDVIGGTIMEIPATDTIRSYTFYNTGIYGGGHNGTTSYEKPLIQCRKIEKYAFYYSGSRYYSGLGEHWSMVLIGYGCEEIQEYAIYGYPGLFRFYIPPTVTSIARNAFYTGYFNYSSSYIICLPDTLRNSGFSNSGIRNCTFSIQYYDATYQSCYTFSDGADSSTITAFSTFGTNTNIIGTYVVPKMHGDKPVLAMNAVFNGKDGSNSYWAANTDILEIAVEAELTTIVANTFRNVKTLKRVILPDTVRVIGDYAFYGCTKLNRLEFNGTVFTSIGAHAFEEVGHKMDVYTDYGHSYPVAGTTYDWQAYNAFEEFVKPMLRVNNNRFETQDFFLQDMSIKPFTFSNSITAIGAYAFHNSVVPTGPVYLPENSSYTTIEEYTFCGAPYITSMYIPDTITLIKPHALEYMYECEYLRIPNNVTLQSTLEGCESLKAISYVFMSFAPNQFKNCHSLVQFMDKGIADVEVNGNLQSSIATIPNYCFYNCEMITDYIWVWDNNRHISDPTPITIGDYAYYGCKRLAHLNGRKPVVSIGVSAFQNSALDGDAFVFLYHGNSNWENLNPNAAYAFTPYPTGTVSALAGDENLVTIDIPLGHYEYDNSNNTSTPITETYMFPTAVGMYEGCTNLTTITYHPYNSEVPEFVNSTLVFPTTIPERCFKGTNLDSATINYMLTFATTISDGAFRGNTSITNLIIPNNITSIGDYAFSDCTNLESVTFTNSAMTIGEGAFSGCTNLETLAVAAGSNFKFVNIPDKCFENCSLTNCETFFTNLESAGERCFAGNKMEHPEFPIAEYGDLCFEDAESSSFTFVTSLSDTLTLGKGCFMSNMNLTEFNLPNNTEKLVIYGGVFEFDYALNLAPHLFYNHFDKVIFSGVYNKALNSESTMYLRSPFNCIFGNTEIPDYGTATISAEFEIPYMDSNTSSYYYNSLMSSLNVRSYHNIVFEKNVPPGTFFTYAGDVTYAERAPSDFYEKVKANGDFKRSTLTTSLETITLGPNFEKVCPYASYQFYSGSEVSVVNNTTGPWTIEKYGFYDSDKIRSVDLTNCTYIGQSAFESNSSLTTLSNTSSLVTIDSGAFKQCTSLKTFDFLGVPNIENDAFNASGVILDSTTSFRSTVKRIGKSAFYNCATVTEVHFDANVSLDYMGYWCFYTSALIKMYFPDNPIGLFECPNNNLIAYNTWQNAPKYRALGYQAFQSVRFNSAVAPSGVYTVDSNCTTFYGGYQFASLATSGNGMLTTLIIPDTVTDLCATVLTGTLSESSYGCIVYNSGITNLYITGNRTSLYSSRFDTDGYTYNSAVGLFRSSKMVTLTLTDSITKIPDYCFYYSLSLVNLNIPEACTEIGQYAFYGCKPAGNVVYLSQRTMLVKTYAFYSTNITSIYLSRECVLENNAIPSNCTKYYYEDMADLTDPKIPGNTPVN